MKRPGRLLNVVPLMALSDAALALDSYRYLHVTIDTPWFIFLFLLPIVLSPLILMAILYWYFSIRKNKKGDGSGGLEKAPEA